MCSHSDAAFAWRHAEPSKNMNDAFNFESFSVIFSPSFSLSSFLPFFLSLPSSSSFFYFFFFFFFFFPLLFLLFLVVFLTRFVYSRQWRRASRREPKIKKASRLARKAAPPRLQTNKKSRLEISIFVFIILIYLIFFNNFFFRWLVCFVLAVRKLNQLITIRRHCTQRYLLRILSNCWNVGFDLLSGKLCKLFLDILLVFVSFLVRCLVGCYSGYAWCWFEVVGWCFYCLRNQLVEIV